MIQLINGLFFWLCRIWYIDSFWLGQTLIFLPLFLAAVLFSIGKKTDAGVMSKETSNELRGLAILGIIFAHLTYGKFYGTGFLFPLGIWAGPAVNLFFFLSGFGLAASAIYHPKPAKDFYAKRIIKIYLPLWISLLFILLIDAFILNHYFPWQEITAAFAGYYPKANLLTSINSPLWFLTPLLFYYLIFPLLFRPKHPRLSVLLFFGISLLAYAPYWPISGQISKYYQSHWLAFPLGVLFAALIVSPQEVCAICLRNSRCLSYKWILSALTRGKDACSKPLARAVNKLQNLSTPWRLLALIVFAGLAWQTAYRSGVGQGLWLEQAFALFTMLCVVMFFIFKKTKFRFLELVGIYSFEIYLLHWPLIGRYDVLYRYLPAWLATFLYLPVLLVLAWLFNLLCRFIENSFIKKIPS